MTTKRVFKSDLRQALADPDLLPGDELSENVQYDNGSAEAFLRWLWATTSTMQPARRLGQSPGHPAHRTGRDGAPVSPAECDELTTLLTAAGQATAATAMLNVSDLSADRGHP
jgi:hypothetical protein